MTERRRHPVRVFTGNANPALAREICEHLGVSLGQADVGRFPDGEVQVPILEHFRQMKLADLTVISPDTGGVERARAFAKKLQVPLAIIDKRREDANTVEVMNVIGEVEGRIALIVDDMIDTGGTLVRGATTLKEKGAERVFACCVHGVFAADAVAKVCNSELEQVVTTNSIPLSATGQQCARIKVLSVAKLLAEAIKSIHDETSVSRLFI